MAAPVVGFQSYMQFGLEATYGTGVAATRRLGFISEDVQLNAGIIDDPTLNNSVSRTAKYQGGRIVQGPIRTTFDYVGLLNLLDALFGTASFGSIGGVTTGASPYLHVFKELGVLNSYTIELVKHPGATALRLLGAKIASLKITGRAARTGTDPMLQAEWGIVAQDLTTNFTPTAALTAPTRTPVLMAECSTKDDGTADIAADVMLKEFELNIVNNLALDRFEAGTLVPREPIRNDFLEVTLRVRKELQTRVLLDAVKAFTQGSPMLVFGSTSSKRVTFDIGSAYIDDGGYKDGISNYGVQFQEATWTAIKDATNASAIKLSVEDTVSTIAAG